MLDFDAYLLSPRAVIPDELEGFGLPGFLLGEDGSVRARPDRFLPS